MRRDGGLVRVEADGTERPLPAAPLGAVPEAAIEAGAAADPDNPELTAARLARLRPVPPVRTLRRALALTQEEFAARFRIPLGTLRDWEQGRARPDGPARAYLSVIASDPETVRRVLAGGPGRE